MKKKRTREEILAKRQEPVVTTNQRYKYNSPVAIPIFNPLVEKVLKNAGDDFKFPGNRDWSVSDK